MNLIKALFLVDDSKWKVRALAVLLSRTETLTNQSTLPFENVKGFSPYAKTALNKALKFLCDNNIAIKLTKQNAKKLDIPYRKYTWILNPNVINNPETFEDICISWKLLTGNEP